MRYDRATATHSPLDVASDARPSGPTDLPRMLDIDPMTTVLAVAELAVATTALVLAFRCLRTPAVLLELRTRPIVRVALAGAAVGAIAIMALAFWNAPFRHAVALMLGLGVLAAVVRSRPTYGARRGLPPGSLGLRASLLAVHDREFHSSAAARWGAVYKTAQVHRPVACIADMALGMALLHHQRDRLRQTAWAANRLAPGGYVEFMNGAQHRRYRHLLASALEDIDDAASNEALTTMMDAHIDRAIASSGAGGFHPRTRADHVAFDSLALLVLAIPPGHTDGVALSRALEPLTGPIDARRPLAANVERARNEVFATIRARGAALPPSVFGPPTSLLASLVMRDRAALDDPTVVGNLLFMLTDGRAMLRRLLTWIVAMGGAHPDRLAALRGDEAQAECFVNEVLRLCTSEYVYRVATADIEVGGYRVPEGWLIRVCLRECHRHPDLFREPERFDPSRFARGEGTPDAFAPFGFEDHVCFVAPTVMRISTLFARRLTELAEWELVSDGPLEHWNRHWTFWEPSAKLRVKGARR